MLPVAALLAFSCSCWPIVMFVVRWFSTIKRTSMLNEWHTPMEGEWINCWKLLQRASYLPLCFLIVSNSSSVSKWLKYNVVHRLDLSIMGMGINPVNLWPIHPQVKIKQRKCIKTLHGNLTYNYNTQKKLISFRIFYKCLQNDLQQDTIEDIFKNINPPKSNKKNTDITNTNVIE